MDKSARIERLRTRDARQACQFDLLDIYCALTGAGSFPGKASANDLRRAIASHLCANLLANSDPLPKLALDFERFPGDEVDCNCDQVGPVQCDEHGPRE